MSPVGVWAAGPDALASTTTQRVLVPRLCSKGMGRLEWRFTTKVKEPGVGDESDWEITLHRALKSILFGRTLWSSPSPHLFWLENRKWNKWDLCCHDFTSYCCAYLLCSCSFDVCRITNWQPSHFPITSDCTMPWSPEAVVIEVVWYFGFIY